MHPPGNTPFVKYKDYHTAASVREKWGPSASKLGLGSDIGALLRTVHSSRLVENGTFKTK
jgi:hypothetical protein